tara:strand:+ start:770 stop:1261 length:492 start_codon:yes stop_codon:yes gene_type:complete
MLNFVDKGEYKLIEMHQLDENRIAWRYEEQQGIFKKGLKANYERKGEVFYPFDEAYENGVVNPKTEEVREYERKAGERAKKEAQKLQGVLINGEQISLTEENQNGMAAVMQGVNLAAEMGADIFPLNFNAQTPAGFKLMTFEVAADFKTFCLAFMAERQKFFK